MAVSDGAWQDRLQQARLRLESLASSISDERPQALREKLGSGAVLDPENGDLAQAISDEFTAATLASVFNGSREQVDRALERLQAGLYGNCEDCGAQIPEERLAFRPESTRCVNCQARHERYAQRGAA